MNKVRLRLWLVAMVAPAVCAQGAESNTTTIPSGTDLYDYFYPAAADGSRSFRVAEALMNDTVLSYSLEQGGAYTLSKTVDFRGFGVTLAGDVASSSNTSRPTLAIGDTASFRTCGALSLRNIVIDASASAEGLVEMSKEPVEGLLGARLKADGSTHDYYNVQAAVEFDNLAVSNLRGRLIFDNSVKYCLEKCTVNNCVVSIRPDESISEGALIHFKGGFINEMSITNSTFWRNGEADIKYFIQYNNSGRADRAGYESDYVTISNCTFYKVCYEGQLCNYSGFQGKSYTYFTMKNSIFVDCSSKAVARRFVGGNVGNANVDFQSNTYMYDGTFEDASTYDKSGTAIESDPMFADPANGDFTVGSYKQKARRTGDPRWLSKQTAGVESVLADKSAQSVSVYSLGGVLVRSVAGDGQQLLSGLAPGLYVVVEGGDAKRVLVKP